MCVCGGGCFIVWPVLHNDNGPETRTRERERESYADLFGWERKRAENMLAGAKQCAGHKLKFDFMGSANK